MNHLVLVLDLPWELKEMINQYLMKMLVISLLKKNLKFPRLWKHEPNEFYLDGYQKYHFTTGYHNFEVFTSQETMRFGYIRKTYFNKKVLFSYFRIFRSEAALASGDLGCAEGGARSRDLGGFLGLDRGLIRGRFLLVGHVI